MELVAIILLILAISLIWSQTTTWIPFFASFVLVALFTNWIQPVALFSILLYLGSLLFYQYSNGRTQKISSLVVLILMSVAMAVSLFPGFEKYIVFQEVFVSENKNDVSLYLTADKGIVGLFLLWLNKHKLSKTIREFYGHIKSVAPVMVTGLILIYGSAIAIDVVELELAFHRVALPLLVSNLFFTVIAEEGLFRGVIQDWLSTLSEKLNRLQFPLLLTSLIFGLLHLTGGWQFALLATGAGLLYGYVYIKTQRIDVPILMHALLNAGIAIMFYTN